MEARIARFVRPRRPAAARREPADDRWCAARDQDGRATSRAHAGRRARARASTATASWSRRRRGSAAESATRSTSPPAPRSRSAERVWAEAEMIIKVKEPLPPEYPMLRPGQVVFTYLHLAAVPDLDARARRSRRHRHRLRDRPALGWEPAAADADERGGRTPGGAGGRLLSRPSARRTRHPAARACPACRAATSSSSAPAPWASTRPRPPSDLGADVSVLDVNLDRLRHLDDLFAGRIVTLASNRFNIAQAIQRADLLVGAVLITGARAPVLVSQGHGRAHEAGRGDRRRGGGSGRLDRDHPPDHARRPDLPGRGRRPLRRREHAGARAAHLDLRARQRHAAATRSSWPIAGRSRPFAPIAELARGVNVWRGRIVHPAVADALGESPVPLEACLGGGTTVTVGGGRGRGAQRNVRSRAESARVRWVAYGQGESWRTIVCGGGRRMGLWFPSHTTGTGDRRPE